MNAPSDAPRVVVIGAGMAGLATVRALANAPVSVQLIDGHNYTTFPPLLFQVATCFLSPHEVARPVRAIVRRQSNMTFRVSEVVGVDWSRRVVRLDSGGVEAFDYVVLATGVVPAFAGVPGAARQAIPLKSVTDANRLRNQLLRSFEQAAANAGSATPEETSIAIVGGGPTGVELAGYVANFLFHQQFTTDYPELDPSAMRVTLLERGPRLLPGFHPQLSRYVLETLRSRGVDVRLATDVVGVDSDGVTVSGGERIPAATVVWAGGVQAPQWIRVLGLTLEQGRVLVDRELRVVDHPEVFVVGDLGAISDQKGDVYPQLAQVAIQSGRHAGRQIERLAAGQPLKPFSYFDKGMMAIVGRNAAVVQTGRLRLTGRLAWIAWGFLHVAYLPGAVNRMTTGLKYMWWHITHENANRLLIDSEPLSPPHGTGDEPPAEAATTPRSGT